MRLVVVVAAGATLLGVASAFAATFSALRIPALLGIGPLAALSIAASGLSVGLLARRGPASVRMRLGRALGGLVALCSAAALAHLLCFDAGATGFGAAEGMTPEGSLGMIALGLALAFAHEGVRGRWEASDGLALVSAGIGMLGLLGLTYGSSRSLFGSWSASMSIPVTCVLTFLSLAFLVSRPERGPAALLRASGAGGDVARRLLPAAIGLPALLGWLRLRGGELGLFDLEAGMSLHTTATIGLLSATVLWTARRLERVDDARQAAEAQRSRTEANQRAAYDLLRLREARFRSVFEQSADAIFITDASGVVVDANPSALQLFGYESADLVGLPRVDLVDPADPRASAYYAVLTGAGRARAELTALRADGSPFEAEAAASSFPSEDGGVQTLVLIRDVTERTAYERSLVDARAAAERASEELESFSYSVSHDLRSPLRSIDGFSQALLEDYAEKLDDRGKDYLNRVRAATVRMAQLIDDLLELSRVTRAELHQEEVDLSEVADAIAEELHQRWSGPKRTFEVERDLVAHGDPRLLRVALENLLENAWKFTSKTVDPRVELRRSPEHGPGAFLVRDNGAGFDETYAGKLFGAFQRLHSTTEFAGTGIGLATVKRIVGRHGGRVWAEGEVSRGATFYFTLDDSSAEDGA